jgi:hypothetical protein
MQVQNQRFAAVIVHCHRNEESNNNNNNNNNGTNGKQIANKRTTMQGNSLKITNPMVSLVPAILFIR